MADQDLSTLQRLKDWIIVKGTNTSDDETLSRLLTATSQDFMRATRRPDLLFADYVEVHQGDGGTRLTLFHWPVTVVTQVKVKSLTVAPSVDKIAPGYYFDADIDSERRWQLYLIGYSFVDGAPVSIQYSAGYVQPGQTVDSGQIVLPGDIEQAVLEWCAYRYKGRPNTGVSQRRSVEGEESRPEQVDAPPSVLQVIERYQRKFPSLDRRADDCARMSRTKTAVSSK